MCGELDRWVACWTLCYGGRAYWLIFFCDCAKTRGRACKVLFVRGKVVFMIIVSKQFLFTLLV